MTDSKSRCVVEISTDTRPIVYLTIDRLSTDYQPTIDRLLTDYRPTVDRLSTYYRPTIDRLSTDYRPLYRPLCRPPCRPQSRSTLPTVNKIQFRQVQPGKVVHLKRLTSFFETFLVGLNPSIEFWTEISGNFGWMDRALCLKTVLLNF